MPNLTNFPIGLKKHMILICFLVPLILWGEVGINYTLQDNGYLYQSGSIYYSFNVLACATEEGTRLGTGIIYIAYNNLTFGNWIQTNNGVIVEKGILVSDVQNSLYNLIQNDTFTNILAITFEYTSESGYGNYLNTIPETLLSIKMKVLDSSEPAVINLWPPEDSNEWSVFMANQQFYDDNETNYNPVTIGTGLNVAYQTHNLTIPLKTGWNLVSSYIEPLNRDLTSVFSELTSSNCLIKVQDEAGNALVQDISGNWNNSIGDLKMDEGYYILVNSDCSLNITGLVQKLPLSISLNLGWNILPFLRTEPISAMTLLQSLIDNGILVKVQDEEGNALFQDINGQWVNGIGNCQPGEGYYINVKENTQLLFEE
jgi:hypothetical protein